MFSLWDTLSKNFRWVGLVFRNFVITLMYIYLIMTVMLLCLNKYCVYIDKWLNANTNYSLSALLLKNNYYCLHSYSLSSWTCRFSWLQEHPINTLQNFFNKRIEGALYFFQFFFTFNKNIVYCSYFLLLLYRVHILQTDFDWSVAILCCPFMLKFTKKIWTVMEAGGYGLFKPHFRNLSF